MNSGFWLKCILATVAAATALPLTVRAADRTTISLDGTWDIEDSKEPEKIPAAWKHKVPVPGLGHSAQPAFPHVDEFDSRMLIQNRVRAGNNLKALSSLTQASLTRIAIGFGTTGRLIYPHRGAWPSSASTRRSSARRYG